MLSREEKLDYPQPEPLTGNNPAKIFRLLRLFAQPIKCFLVHVFWFNTDFRANLTVTAI